MEHSIQHSDVIVEAEDAQLDGFLDLPEDAEGIVVFAHGSGSSRFSSRNRAVAAFLNEAGLASLLFDLLTAEEHRIDVQTRELRFDIDLLSRRLLGAIDWIANQARTQHLNIGLFGASTGAAAALIAAARNPQRVVTVVSRGGRPDLAGSALEQIDRPVLLIVGGLDDAVIEMNRSAQAQMPAKPVLTIVDGASHLFEEPGKLDQVAQQARDWFSRHLADPV